MEEANNKLVIFFTQITMRLPILLLSLVAVLVLVKGGSGNPG